VRNAALGLSALALTGALVTAPQLAQADPPLTVDEAKAQIAELETEAAAIDQEYVGVKQGLAQSAAQLKLKKADVKSQATKVQRLRVQAGQVALAQFQNQHLDAAAKLLLSEDTDEFLSQISTVEKVSENQNSVLQEYQQQEAAMAALALSAKTDLAALTEQEKQLKALRAASDKKIADSKAVLAKLSAEERRKIEAEERRAAADARAEAESDTKESGTEESGTKTKTKATSNNDDDDEPAATGGSGKGARALAFARAQLGKPYRYASAGPNAYDCSGLTYAAWKSVGVSLPRS
jgi:cell wall-associated NlpC family hydrolase